jgi:pimeloyl-ACP methyl ester carboxylesterase
VQPDRAVVVGQSTGGWATIAYGSLPHPKVSALISMAGGRGGQANGVPGQTCRADLLAYSAAYFATTNRTPMLWIYAANDSNFSPDTARAMAQSYQAAGGALQYEPLPAFDGDGHTLFLGQGGSAIWGPIVERYLSTT